MYFRLSSKYFNLALEKGFITNNGLRHNGGNSTYKATPKGLDFVEAYKKIKALK